MGELGTGWSRTTVAKLEAGRRGSVSVGELLALAVVFGLPPIWLLVDPESSTAVPVAAGVELDPWTALLWMIGKRPLSDPPAPGWDRPALVLERLYALVAGVDEYRRHQRVVADLRARDRQDDYLARQLEDQADVERYLLESIAKPLRELDGWGMPVPPVPPDVAKHAAEHGVELPGQDQEG